MTALAWMLGLAWAGLGLATARALGQRGEAPGTCAAAVVGWPFVAHLVVGGDGPGPRREALDAAFDGLARAGRVTGLESRWGAELAVLRRALERADARLAAVDRVAAVGPAASAELAPTLARLAAAQADAAAEIDAVVTELTRLRVQVAIVALSGDVRPVREGLRALTARVAALDEVARLAPGGWT